MPSARYVHPEFGYFCPTPRLLRRLRQALVCLVLGAIGIAVLRAHHDFSWLHSPISGSAMMARVDHGSDADFGSAGGNASDAAALGLRPALSQGVKTACEDDTWAYLDGKCVAGKERKARVVRVPSNRPAIATTPLGRGGAPVAGAAQPAAAVATAADGRKGDFSPSKPAPSAQSARDEASVTPTTVATEPSQQPVAAPKKPHRTAHSQNRRRDRMDRAPAHGYASVPDQRYGPYGGFFSFYR